MMCVGMSDGITVSKDKAHKDFARVIPSSTEDIEELRTLGEIVQERFDLSSRKGSHKLEKEARARRDCLVTPTVDGIGCTLPRGVVPDTEYLESLWWPSLSESHQYDVDRSFLDEAERRLQDGDLGTALILSKNLRTTYWYSNWEESKEVLLRTSAVIGACFDQWGRRGPAQRIRAATEWAIRSVY